MYIIINSNANRKWEKPAASAIVNSEKVFSFAISNMSDVFEVAAKTGTEIQILRAFKTEDEARRLIGAIVEALEAKQGIFDVEAFLEEKRNPDAKKWQ